MKIKFLNLLLQHAKMFCSTCVMHVYICTASSTDYCSLKSLLISCLLRSYLLHKQHLDFCSQTIQKNSCFHARFLAIIVRRYIIWKAVITLAVSIRQYRECRVSYGGAILKAF